MSRRIVQAIVVFGIILLLLPVIIRSLNGSPLMPGIEGYGHARIAQTIAQSGIPDYDPAMPERPYTLTAFDLLLALTAMLTGIETAAIILPLVLGLLSIFLFSAILRRWNVNKKSAIGMLLVFVVSPAFVAIFTQATGRSLELFLFLLYILLISPVEKRKSSAVSIIAALLVAAIIATISVASAAIAFVLPIILRGVSKKVPAQSLLSSISAFIVFVAVSLPVLLQAEKPPFGSPVPFVQAVSDFGSGFGLGLFAWLLAFIGFILLWQYKTKYYTAMIAIGVMLLASLLLPSALTPAHILVSILAGYALSSFAQMKWSFDDIRVLTILVLVCGLLFSALSHDLSIARGPPTKEVMEAALAIKAQFPEKTTVLSVPENGFWIEYWSGRQAFLDSWASKTPRIAERWAAAQSIWHSQDIINARSLLYKNRINALVITEDMRDRLVWELPEQDLLFLLRNNETFKNAHHSSIVDIWAVLPPVKTA